MGSYIWRGLEQPDNPFPAKGWCEPGRHDRSWESEETWVCSRCGARGWHSGKEPNDITAVRRIPAY